MLSHHSPHKCRILFILKKRLSYGAYTAGFSSGLYNSAKFSADMLEASGFNVKLVEVIDNNGIDHEVDAFDPSIVIIEALWVVPAKFDVLTNLHPTVTWIVRVHSEAPFLAQEGISIDWLSQYPTVPNVFVAMNSREGFDEVMTFWAVKGLHAYKLLYLPTFYPAPRHPHYHKHFDGDTISIACMGAIRPLKNHLTQAIAAMNFVDEQGWTLRFHINVTRNEAGGNAPYRSVLSLFQGTSHQLVQHDWMTHEEFIDFLRQIDFGLQVSFSETFCIVAADLVASGIPTVGSRAIRWLDDGSKASTNSVQDIVEKMGNVLNNDGQVGENLENLQHDAEKARDEWLDVIGKFC